MGQLNGNGNTTEPNVIRNKYLNLNGLSSFWNGVKQYIENQIPTHLPNPENLTIQGNGTSLGVYNGLEAKTINITPTSIGALSLSGGTLTGNLTINNNTLKITGEKYIVFNTGRYSENGGGWATTQLTLRGPADSDGNTPNIYSLGAYGNNNELKYIYIGANGYSSVNNLRISPDGNIIASSFTGKTLYEDGISLVDKYAGKDHTHSITYTKIPTTTDESYSLLMTRNSVPSGTITDAAQYHEGLTYNPATQTLGLGILNCTASESESEDSNTIWMSANRPLPTTFMIAPSGLYQNVALPTYLNLMYSGPGLSGTESKSSTGLSIGPNVIDDTTTNGFLISTDKPLRIVGSPLSFGVIGDNMIPNQNNTYNLGTLDNKWFEVHANWFKGTADSARLTPYGVCETAATTAAKTVTTSVPFVLETGARISVKFTNTNTVSNMTLNVNSTVDKNVYFNGSKVGSNTIFQNNIYDFIYDGTNWILQPGIQNRTGSSNSPSSTLYLIGAPSQSPSGVQTYSNSDVYTKSGAIYTNGGFYDKSTTTGASVYKAVVPKDYTEGVLGESISGPHALSQQLSHFISIPSPKFGGLVFEKPLHVGSETTLNPAPRANNSLFSTTLAILLTADETVSNFRFVRLCLSVPLTIQNTSVYSLRFSYIVAIALNGGTPKTTTYTFTLSPVSSRTIGDRSIIFDLMKQTIIDDTDNGTTSWI